ncbi:MAG TPA: DUF2155 domain-containing protein [Rhizomicrobium sp.]
MKLAGVFSASLVLIAAPAFAQTASTNAPATAAKPAAPAAAPGASATPAQPSSLYKAVTPAPAAALTIPQPYNPMAKLEQAALNTAVPAKDGVKRMIIMRGLDKITGRPANILAPVGVPVKYATLTITARYCYSTPITEPPETTAFVQIEDHRPDQDARQVFSGWMLASSPSLNGLQHPLYDVWVMSCATNQPGQQLPLIASTSTVKATSPDATSKEAMPDLPEDSGQ